MTWVPEAALDPLVQAVRVYEISPLDTRAQPQQIVLTNIAVGIQYVYCEVSKLKWFGADLDFSAALGVGVTIEESRQDDGTAPGAISNWFDISNAKFGAASWNADAQLENTTPLTVKYLRFKVDNTGGAGTEDLTLYVFAKANG